MIDPGVLMKQGSNFDPRGFFGGAAETPGKLDAPAWARSLKDAFKAMRWAFGANWESSESGAAAKARRRSVGRGKPRSFAVVPGGAANGLRAV